MKLVELDGSISIASVLEGLEKEFGKPQIVTLKVKYFDNSFSTISCGGKTTITSEKDLDGFLPLITGALSGLTGMFGKNKEKSEAPATPSGDERPATRKDIKKLYRKLIERLAPVSSNANIQ
jgi:hypothetical protein